jgi:hypothetical protein
MSSLLPAQGDPGHSCQQCAPLNLDTFFLEPREFNAGPVTRFIGSSCPLAKAICLALDLYCGPAWATLSQVESASATVLGPNLLLKRRAWCQAFGFLERVGWDYGDDPHHARLMMALDSQPSWTRPVTYEGKPLPDWVDQHPHVPVPQPPHVFGELEMIPEPHTRGRSDPSWSTKNLDLPQRRPITPIVDTTLIRTWLDSCKHSDASHCASSETLWDGKGFRLIDVQLRCLAHVTERHEYLALSYPWGETARGFLCADTSNIDALCRTGSLDVDVVKEHLGKTPSRTVLDAMHLARGLGFRYLWVDALCILQDDADERRRLIHGMGGIYGAATCTIICAAGTNADSGLKGVWNTARQRLPYDEPVRLSGSRLQNFSVMISRPSLDSEVRRSHWNTRGWTYQEMCLSSRSLYFTAGEVFFSCFSCHNREGYELRDALPHESQIMAKTSPAWDTVDSPFMEMATGKVHFHGLPSDPDDFNFFVYRTVVQDYTKRELTLSSDVINAFQGVFNRFIDPGKTHLTLVHEVQCIPPRFLHLALLWYPISGSVRGCSSSQRTALSEFPSWSWTSWHGPVIFVPANVTLGSATVWDPGHRGLLLPEELGCLIQSSELPRLLSPRVLSFSKKAVTKILALSSPATRQLPEELDQNRESSCPPGGIGVLELWVPVLLGSAVRLVVSSVPGWRTLSLSRDKEGTYRKLPDGGFRLDQDSGTAMSLHSYLAVAVSRGGTVGVVGVVENDDDKTFRRVGVGWVNLDWYWERAYGNPLLPNKGTTWTLKRVLLR